MTRALLFVSALVVAQGGPSPAVAVVPGLDLLRVEADETLLARLEGKRIGLITNHTGVAMDGTPALMVLRDELGLEVVALFSPEHGYTGDVAAGDIVDSGRAGEADLPVHSLYGATREPTEAMLEGIDALVFDIQDIGVRFYTYVSTMKLAMEAAARSRMVFVVLDRPNPNGGLRVEGPVLEEDAFSSFVGVRGLPLLHGMTVGELARMFRSAIPGGDALELYVVPVGGLTRNMLWADTGLPWRPPSPNIRTVEASVAFAAMGLLEGINVSEGRGIEETFERVGAPWIDGEALARSLNAEALPGARFEPVSFVPRVTAAAPRPKYPDETCHGVTLIVDAPSRFEAVRAGLATIAAIRRAHPDRFAWVRQEDRFWLDLLLGTDRPRRDLDAGRSVEAVLASGSEAVERFRSHREPFLLYR